MINWLLSLINVRQRQLYNENLALKKRNTELTRALVAAKEKVVVGKLSGNQREF